MANVNAPFGFRHIGFNNGGPVANFATRQHKIAAGYGVALYKGDVVVHIASGYVAKYATGADGYGSNVAGVVLGFEYLSTSLGRKVWTTYLPTSDYAYDVTVHVVPISGVPSQLFIVQAYSTAFTITDVGQNIEPCMTTSGTVIGGYGKSGMTIAQSTNEAATNTHPFRIVDLYSNIAPKGVNGIEAGAYNIVVVASNPFEATGI